MADEHNPNDPRFDWLYAGQPDDGDGDGRSEPEDAAGSDHTRMLPQAPRPDSSRPGKEQPTSFGGVYPRTPPAQRRPSQPSQPPSYGPPQAASPDQTRWVQQEPRSLQPTTTVPGGGGPGYAQSQPPPAGPSASARRPRRRRRFRWVRLVLALIVLWLAFLVVVPVYAWNKVSKVDAEPAGARPPVGPGTTYLLVGSDSREGLTPQQEHDLGTGSASGQRTDTIIVLHVSDSSGPNVMLSIPRDSYVAVPGHGMQKINASYAYGGPKLLVQTVEQATGIHIDDYVEIGFTGVVDVVDAVGGIQVCPKTSINDPKAGNLVMKAGCQHVDGHTALDYSRSRAFPLGDITRAFHQREVIAATGSAAASWQTIAFPWRYWGVNMAGAASVQVGDNVGPFAFAKFAWAMAHSSGSGTKRCVVPFSSLGTSTSVGSVVEWDKPKADAIFHDISSDDTSAIRCTGQ